MRPIDKLTAQDAKLEKCLLDKECRDPDPEKIINFLAEIYDFAQSTVDSHDFKFALRLLQKWKVILINFYNRSYSKSVSRLPDDFSLAARYGLTDSQNKQIEESQVLVMGLGSGSKSDDVTTQEQVKEDVSLVPPPSQKDKAVPDSPFFPKRVT